MMDGIYIKKGKILVVDDEPMNIVLLEEMLHTDEYSNVLSTGDPTRVLEICQMERPDLILLDLNMPVLSGFGVMEQLEGLDESDRPVIMVLSAESAQSQRQRALDQGARDYVTKPFNMGELLSRVRNLVEMKLLQNHMRSRNQMLEL